MVQPGKPPSSYLNRWWLYGHRLLEKVVGIKEPAVLEIFEGVGCCVSKNNFKIHYSLWLGSFGWIPWIRSILRSETEFPGNLSNELLTLCIE